jgi:hypothetical protein
MWQVWERRLSYESRWCFLAETNALVLQVEGKRERVRLSIIPLRYQHSARTYHCTALAKLTSGEEERTSSRGAVETYNADVQVLLYLNVVKQGKW